MSQYLLGIDQGTTNSRAIIFNREGIVLSQYELPLTQSFPQDGWVEQDALEMVEKTIICCQEAIKKSNLTANDIAGIGISNQRETTIIWDRKTGKPIYPAIVWQDRRTSEICKQFATHPIAEQIQAKTGLLLDPYFSATKIIWLLEHVPGARQKADNGELAFGTVDTFLLWHLTQGKSHATDATNASRTLLFNIQTQHWDKALLSAFNIPDSLLPTVLDCSAEFGFTDKQFFGKPILIAGVAGDQQAATIGQACFKPGMVKTTYGTGCFMFLNTGNQIIFSKNKLLSTVAYRLKNKVTYGLEGSIFSAGVSVKWLRDNLKLIDSANETEAFARSINDTNGVYLVPAFTGLGAPYWDPHARAAILGLTRNSQKAEIIRAALEAVAYQSKDLLIAMEKDSGTTINQLRVDGGMVANRWLLQFLSDVLNIQVERPIILESSALGVAYLAGLQVGFYESIDEIAMHWQAQEKFTPHMLDVDRKRLYEGWLRSVKQVINPHAN